MHRRLGKGIGTANLKVSAAAGAQLADRGCKSRKIVQRGARQISRQGCEVKLDIGPTKFRAGLKKGAGLIDADRHWPTTLKHILQAHSQLAPPAAHIVVGGQWLIAAVNHPYLQMILQILSYARTMTQHLDTMRLEQPSITNA